MNVVLQAIQDPAVWIGVGLGLLISWATRRKS